MRISKNKFAAVAGLLSLAAAGTAIAQETPADRYARAMAEVGIATRYNAHLEQQLRSQEQEIASIEQQIASLDMTAVDVQPMLQRMFDELVQFVQNDLPFFKQERDERIQRLTELMANVDATPSEKFRRLIEAYQIEMEYGRTMTAYRETLADGRAAEMVRLGRVALMYRVIDSGEVGYWDKDAKQFIADPDSRGQVPVVADFGLEGAARARELALGAVRRGSPTVRSLDDRVEPDQWRRLGDGLGRGDLDDALTGPDVVELRREPTGIEDLVER